ncbi:Hematopoietic prostaglandin D synthase [Phytophthora nicotianae]|uniref:Hematopoietic prostaglandin D synthase n=1 Tax=Phytophthora nicotianae TaxID=4792 RepID=A0A0W8D5D3_PHYNI|nr:Hematopoietic prostaglandin D synthase [Phytophthora nicotianae]
MQCDLQVEPRYVMCDFELGLVNAVRQQFAGVPIVGCLFHWKQALRRKLIDLRIPKETVSHVMASGAIDVLTVIPIDEIAEKGIPSVRSRVDESGHRVKWDTFWRYFKRTWMRTYDPALWNVNAISETMDIVNRTNNALERFNRDLNESFSSAHPNLLPFMAVIKQKSKDHVELIEDIRHHRQEAPPHGNLITVEIPAAYRAFCEQQEQE